MLPYVAVIGALAGVVGVGGMLFTARALGASDVSTFLPGPLASPRRYLSAVNAASTSATVEAADALGRKQALDRFEALALGGVALVIATVMRRTESRIAVDGLAVCALGALACAGMSLVELP